LDLGDLLKKLGYKTEFVLGFGCSPFINTNNQEQAAKGDE
jgi:hypothetical protein